MAYERIETVPLFHAQPMTDALKKANVPLQLIIVKNADHGYTFVAPPCSPPTQGSQAEVDTAVLKFLDANLKKLPLRPPCLPANTAVSCSSPPSCTAIPDSRE